MLQAERGGTLVLQETYQWTDGSLYDPNDPHLDLIAPDGTIQLDSVVPTRNEFGTYSYVWAVPADAPLGNWTVRWVGTRPADGNTYVKQEGIYVVAAGQLSAIADAIGTVRMFLADKDAEVFTDDDLTRLMLRNNSWVTKTVAEGWQVKAALYSSLSDVDEAGSARKLSQLYRQAANQVDAWNAAVENERTLQAANIGRVPGMSIDILVKNDTAQNIFWTDPKNAVGWTVDGAMLPLGSNTIDGGSPASV